MSGGFFNYDQYKICRIADTVEMLVDRERFNPEHGPEVLQKYIKALVTLRVAADMVTAIDYFESGDTSKETFLQRWSDQDMDFS